METTETPHDLVQDGKRKQVERIDTTSTAQGVKMKKCKLLGKGKPIQALVEATPQPRSPQWASLAETTEGLGTLGQFKTFSNWYRKRSLVSCFS